MSRVLSIAILVCLCAPRMAVGQTSYSIAGATYSQGFDSLATSGTNNAWSNNVTIEGWFLFRQPTPGTAITGYNAGDGGSNAGSFYSFGTGTDAERALGGVGSGAAYFGAPVSGAVAGWMAVALTNDTGATIDDAQVLYDGEQWRNGGNATAQTMVMQWGIGATFGAVTWNTPGAAFDFTSPIATATAGALNGNDAANRVADRGGSLTSLGWDQGETLWFRWIENNDAGNDHGLSLDNFRFTGFAPVPEPSAILLGMLGAVGLLISRRRGSRNRIAFGGFHP